MTILTNKEKIALFRLYEKELEKRLQPLFFSTQKASELRVFLDENWIENLSETCENQEDFARQLLKDLLKSPVSGLYETFLNYLANLGGNDTDNLHRMFSVVNDNIRRSLFRVVLENLDDFLKFIDVTKVLSHLKKYHRYDEIVENLESALQEEEDLEMQKKIVLRTTPLLGPMALYDIIYGFYGDSDDPRMEEFVERIFPNFMSIYKMKDYDRAHPRNTIVHCPVQTSAEELIREMGTVLVNSNPGFTVVDLNWESIPVNGSYEDQILESINHRLHQEEPICLREYQKELCQDALEGRNTIISAPTGSGKTVVAAHIIKEHLESKDNRRRKVLFMTPNSVILQQQCSNIGKYLQHRYVVKTIQGAENIPTYDYVMSCDMVVATPQMIVNLCDDNYTAFGATRKPFYLTEFTLIVFDECHATKKSSPYSNIMKIYHEMKYTKSFPDGHYLPQIIGLTASLGVGKAQNDVQACEHIAKICANLDVQKISRVRKCISDLKLFSPVTPDVCSFHPNKQDAQRREWTEALQEMMRRFEIRMMRIVGEEDRAEDCLEFELLPVEQVQYSLMRRGFEEPPDEKEDPRYLNWVSNQLKDVPVAMIQQSRKARIIEILEILKISCIALGYKNDFNTEVAYEYLNSEMQSRERTTTQESKCIWEGYQSKLKNATNENPIVQEVERLLLQQNSENRDFRAIIFIQTRNGANLLKLILNSSRLLKNEGIESESISGINQSDDDAKNTKKEQEDKLQRFAKGDVRVLVATSVAEEGLDIAKCNLVIKYNYATNEIAHVQRRGRGRAENSRCILVTNKLALKEQEEKNKMKEKYMNAAMLLIQNGEFNLIEAVKSESRDIWRKIIDDKEMKEINIQRQTNENIKYTILCKKCNTELTTNEKIRVEKTQYLVCDTLFWPKVIVVDLSNEDMASEKYGAIGKIKCKGTICGTILGRLLIVRGAELPCLAAEAIVLRFTNSSGVIELKAPKKWKEITTKYFTPGKVTVYDLSMARQYNRELRTQATVANCDPLIGE